MQNYTFLKPSNKLEIIANGHNLYCTIYFVENDGITVFTDNKNQLSEQDIEINIYSFDGIYYAKSKILSSNELNGQIFYRLAFPMHIKHTQRREYLRADIETDFTLNVTHYEDEVEKISSVTKNICAKGLCFIASKPIKTYSQLSIELYLGGRVIFTHAEIVYSNPVRVNNSFKFMTAVTFTDVSKEAMDFITKECIKFKS